MPQSPIILVKANGNIMYGGQYKDHVIEAYDAEEGDVLMFAWVGKFRTDVFRLTKEDLERHYK